MPKLKPFVRTAANSPAVVDEIGDIEAALLPLKPRIARLDKLRKELRDSLANEQPSATFTLPGTRFVLEVSASGKQSVIDVAKVFAKVGAKKFLAVCGITLGVVEGFNDVQLLKEVVTVQLTGPRTLKVHESGKKKEG